MSLIAILEQFAYMPLADSNVIRSVGESNEVIREKIIKELSRDNPDVLHDQCACEKTVVSMGR
ncbi:MAG: hypothetical protein A3E88_03995 [Legionellales bacterium RIFCSPHIGHO2_12_FULL_35_11]|nr:MAG: hypothetical protein A3E88_03995 [Legionellales bacterium RIFCSPHIGHO2_12_FULL_35_11]